MQTRQMGQLKRPAATKQAHNVMMRPKQMSLGGYWLAIILTTSCLVISGNDFRHSGVYASSMVEKIEQQPSSINSSPVQPDTPVAAPTIPVNGAIDSSLKPESDQRQSADNSQQQKNQDFQQQLARQARAESSASASSAGAPSTPDASPSSDANSADTKSTKQQVSPAPETGGKKESQPLAGKKSPSGSASKQNPTKSSANGGKSISSSSSNGKPRLQANLGSTILQGSVNQMSKHDAYSAIAEKHGALAQDAMRRTDKRRIGNGGFGPAGIQKASGLGDIFNPVKGMSDGGLARTLGASMRSMMKGKYSVPAYVASALLGAVALMAFYESPISPLPVPPLPEAPAGRFPPEMPNLPPNTQVPFRYNPNQNYNQRSLSGPMQSPQQPMLNQQQVFFPVNQQTAQQRSQVVNTAGSSSGPSSTVSQIASNILNVAKGPSQIAQRKSGSDYETSGAKSLFNPINMALKSASTPLTGKLQNASAKSSGSSTGSGFLSYFGLGSSPSAPVENQMNGISGMMLNNQQQLQQPYNQLSVNAESKSGNSATSGQSTATGFLSKFKSYFSSSSPKPISNTMGSSQPANSPSENSYNRINFIQNLMKDASSSLPRFLSPGNRKVSSPTSSNPAAAQASANPTSLNNGGQSSGLTNSQSMSNLFNSMGGGSGSQMMAASSRASQMGPELVIPQTKNQKNPSGFMKVAHALLDSFTTGIAQRNAMQGSEYQSSTAIKPANSEQDVNGISQAPNSPLQMATMVVSDLLNNYQGPQASPPSSSSVNSPSSATSSSTSSSSSPAALSSNQEQSSLINNDGSSVSGQEGAKSHILVGESIARSGESSDIAIAVDDNQPQGVLYHNSLNQNHQPQVQQPSARSQNSYSSSSSSIQSQSPIHHQPQLQKEQQHLHQAPSASSISAQIPNAQTSMPNQQQDTQSIGSSSNHVRKTRSIGPGFPESNSVSSVTAQPSRAAQINAFVDYVADSYAQNKLVINFVMNQVGLSQAVPYVEQILGTPSTESGNHWK